ncbi:MAG: DUF933 domain-containing protein [Candidatus Krumholzibacteriia bacterium]
MQIGIIGLKFAGKTTLFNAITGTGLPTGQGGVDPHRAVGKVPDPRLDRLTEMFRPRRTVQAQVEWVDVPGFETGTAAGGVREATRFLEHARRVDALAVVMRDFDGGYGAPDPAGDLETLLLELTVADLEIVERRCERLASDRKKLGKVANPQEPDLMERFRTQLEAGRPLRELELSGDEQKLISGFSFLTSKPLVAVVNHAEGETPDPDALMHARDAGAEVVALCLAVEAELAQLDAAEAQEFLAELGIEEPAVARMIRAAYAALQLQSFFTVGPDECRAWTVKRGTLAPRAGGVIHSDLERGFIRAEVVRYDDLVNAGSMAAARDAGRVRLEGKNYEIQDGDIVEIRFSV